MRGGTRILAYEITAFLGSIPFITVITWRAGSLGLNKRSAFFLTAFLCVDVMLFPWALRIGWIKWWILSIGVLFLSTILWPKVNNCHEEIIEKIQAQVVDSEGAVNLEERILRLPIEELIDLGFEEKYSENFAQAASYFCSALAQDPRPELAFSLIIDCYWLWRNLGERDYALSQLKVYIQKYLPLFNPEFSLQFETWMLKENIQKE